LRLQDYGQTDGQKIEQTRDSYIINSEKRCAFREENA